LVDFAVSLADRHGLSLRGVSVIDEHRLAAPEPVPLGGGAFKAELDLQRLEAARQGAADAAAALTAAAEARSVPLMFETCEGDVVAQLIRRVNAVDCLVCGHTAGSDASERSLLSSILKHNPRPAIVVPDTPFGGRNIMVAYDGSFQAARALGEFAQCGLAAGRTTFVVSLHDDMQEARRLAEEAVAHLARHEVVASPRAALLKGRTGRQLLEQASLLEAGLLVMGAFGHTAVREFFFGSTSRDILDTLPLSLFLDH
jgi:nucleotide-binding universal stress UspA family protein